MASSNNKNLNRTVETDSIWTKRQGYACHFEATFLLFSFVFGTINYGNAASPAKITCIGNLTNTRENGVTLGECDLNFLSVKQVMEIESICGIPGTIDSPAENQCRIRAVVSPNSTPAADHNQLFRVIDVWSVDKR